MIKRIQILKRKRKVMIRIKIELKKKLADNNKVVKRNKSAPRTEKYNVEEHVNDILDDIEDKEDLVGQAEKRVKMFIKGKKLPNNIHACPLYNVSFHS